MLGLARSVYDRYQQRRERQFILQLLTHELRTPIASLGLTVEMLRNQFDSLDEGTQDVLWRLLADHQRLNQLTETSKGYLSTDKSEQFKTQTASLSEWLDNVCDCVEINYTLEEDKTLTLPFYWLSICLKNLIQNAHQHGGDTVWIRVCVGKRIRVCVYDDGVFPSWWQRVWRRCKAPKSEHNMGIGL
ncbi:sensor histidine kinase [Salinivibrio socompensis]|uniref:sensor histidine kinase n=1 Tax=Salinivibrio socompensis TaxID=1510206 RepID=UPI0023E39E42|nr:histidine kinase dimerization/phospho-acceptor domain-containing protein [Salinivibrio socompensis]